MKNLNYKSGVFLLLIVVGVLFLSFWAPDGFSFTRFPKYWWDEAFAIEQARTLVETGKLDFIVAPNTVSGNALALSANGPPLSIPLAGVFSVFGIGIAQARIYMVAWILVALIAIFIAIWKLFGAPSAVAGVVLIGSFASFYANGRTATGDIPGFFFLMLGLLFIFHKRSYAWGGVLLALAAITKTSLFHMVLPAAFLSLVVIMRRDSIKPIARFVSGSLVVIISWFGILLPNQNPLGGFSSAVQFFAHPSTQISMISKLISGVPIGLPSSTLLYFCILFSIVVIGLLKYPGESEGKHILVFYIIYTALQAIAFMRSPGWIRYLLGWQLLTLALLFPALRTLARRKAVFGVVSALVVLQIAQYIFLSNISPGIHPSRRAEAVDEILADNPNSAIWFVNDPITSALVPSGRKYHFLKTGKFTHIGVHPLDMPVQELPTFIMGIKEETDKHKLILSQYYVKGKLSDGAVIYKHR